MPNTTQREKFLHQFKKSLGAEIPPRVPPRMRVFSKRNFFQLYDEWKIEYDVESPETMCEEAGRVVSAYLLIPAGKQCPPESKPPFPAMICYHQCNCDCTIGKEAVVGKVVERTDQAYGLELVRQGFVVLAPDAISCGERELPWRQERKPAAYQPGVQRECWLKSCYWPGVPRSPMNDYFGGRDLGNKVITDGLQAVDLLSSLDFVDSNRIGAIGHSLGQEFVRVHMAYDTRIKIGITSPGFTGTEEQLACTAPRPLIGLQGTHDGDPTEVEKNMERFAVGQRIYQEAGAPENLILRTHPCTHFFCDQFKWEAYLKLREFFGMTLGNKDRVILEEVLREASSWWGCTAEIQADGEHRIRADRESLKRAFGDVYGTFGCKTNPKRPKARTEFSGEEVRVVLSLPESAWRVETPLWGLRSAEQMFFENSGKVSWKYLPEGIEYCVTFPLAR